LAQRDEKHGNSLPEESNGGMEASNMMHLPHLNSPMEPTENMNKPGNFNGQDPTSSL
jgi:hypothetical protein